jgi:hypothetical protein
MDPEDLLAQMDATTLKAWIEATGGPPDEDGAAYNAFQHVYGSALMSKQFGRGVALTLGGIKESRDLWSGRKEPGHWHEGAKDSCNNVVGAQIGKMVSGTNLGAASLSAVRDGVAITDAFGDKRIPAKPSRLPIGPVTLRPAFGR